MTDSLGTLEAPSVRELLRSTDVVTRRVTGAASGTKPLPTLEAAVRAAEMALAGEDVVRTELALVDVAAAAVVSHARVRTSG